MIITEIFHSLQGEGRLTGTPSIFIRLGGCNLACAFCDTPFASRDPEGELMSVSEVLEQVKAIKAGNPDTTHVVLTGGEPMLDKDFEILAGSLARLKYHITVETNGTVYRRVKCDLMSISPKLASSTPPVGEVGALAAEHESTRFQPKVIERLIDKYDYQLKFVVDSDADCDEVKQFLDARPSIHRDRVHLMSQGKTAAELEKKKEWILHQCEDLKVKYCPRRHIEWFGSRRGV
ncbi:MAG: 7-carboxy-7-deazaguanine synthase QueE [Planctomycetia bacterium]|jgi:7-carboxy-7-deazaguanine synthase